MKRKLLVLLMAVVMLAAMMPVGAVTAALGEETLVSVEIPAEDPVEAPAEKPAEKPTEAPVEESKAPAEESEPAAEPAEESVAATAAPFKATVRIELKETGDIFYGDRVTLRAKVEANAEYTVVWEYLDEDAKKDDKDDDVWVAVKKGDTYAFDVNEENAVLTYRAVVNGEVISAVYKLPAVQVRPEEVVPDAAEEPVEEVEPEEAEEPVEEAEPEEAEEAEAAEDEEPAVEDEEPAEETEVAADEEPVAELDPDREIRIRAQWDGDLSYGDEVTLVAELTGYENAVYTVQWETSKDNANWTEVEGATELTYTFVLTEDNCQDSWHLAVNVTGIIVEEA